MMDHLQSRPQPPPWVRTVGLLGEITSYAELVALYPPDVSRRDWRAYVRAPSGSGDSVWVCTKLADDSYAWVLVHPKLISAGIVPVADDTDVAVADGVIAFTIGDDLNGYNLIELNAVAGKTVKPDTDNTQLQVRRVRIAAALGDSTTQFDITNPAATTFRYTYDGTGTDPNIADSDASLRVDDYIDIQAQNFNAANNGYFQITGVGANYFEIDNAVGVVESDKTIGTGSITPTKQRDMFSAKPTIADGEWIASAGTIDTDNDDVLENDQLFIDVDTVHSGTAPKGLSCTMKFQKP